MNKQDIQVALYDKQFKLFISHEQIQQKLRLIAAEMSRDYQGTIPIFLAVLSGSFMFTSDLLKQYPLNCEIAFVRLKSYHGTESSGEIKTILGLQEDIKNRHVVIVEDIVDSGKTMHDFMPILQQMEPATIAIASLLVKPEAIEYPVEIKYRGFDISNEFVVGYGLDYDGLGRNLPDIYQLAE